MVSTKRAEMSSHQTLVDVKLKGEDMNGTKNHAMPQQYARDYTLSQIRFARRLRRAYPSAHKTKPLVGDAQRLDGDWHVGSYTLKVCGVKY